MKTFGVRVYGDEDKYVFVDEIDSLHRHRIVELAESHLSLFEIDGRTACPFATILEYSAGSQLRTQA